ncbi:hypothetical protein CDD81_5828 [Ophiocordyceps australis]|uniref:Rhodopsin domain-containing protein n=1 Tax=Ophiocordyceps australis TaxID=1399860 RepID=A0A2C5X9S4_9HYPO|nr:hypothetical protein CDD81_5828 [Ophiocordyceps australis]
MADDDVDLNSDLGGSLIATCISLLVLSWIAVSLRTYTRAVVIKSFQVDDWLMLAAQLIFTVACAFILEGVRRGLGRHNDAVPEASDRVAALMWQALATALYILDMMFIKLSIGIFLLRLSVGKVYQYILQVSLVVIALWSMGVFLWDVFQCTPVAKQWDFRITHGRCASPGEIISAAYAISALSIISDWLYALLPIPMVWNVKMTKQAKATVIVILGLGIFASVATLIRLNFLSGLEHETDLMYSATDAMIWTLVEPGVAIIASSLATIRPLLRAMRVKGFTSTDRTPASDGTHSGKRNAYNSNTHGTQNSTVAYGLQDVELHNIGEGVETWNNDFPTNHIGLTRDDVHPDDAVARRAQTRLYNDPKSEVYVIEGNRTSSLSTDESYYGSRTLDNSMRDLEAQDKNDYENLGLGASGRRS